MRRHVLVQKCFVVETGQNGKLAATAELDPVGLQREQSPELPQPVEVVDDRVIHGS
jgi:hypothetical protein